MNTNSLPDIRIKRRYYIVYTIMFCVLVSACFFFLFTSDISLVKDSDGWRQHLKAQIYFASYLREIIRTLLSDHQLIIPAWDFHISEGNDILNTLHYYAIGDPLTWLCVFIPTKYMHFFYTGLSLFRLYLAGITFSVLCFNTGKNNPYAILTGALSYAFCSWGLVSASEHPFFINPMILFPLMILGIEKIIAKEKPYVFIIASALSASCNFYFFYMIVLLAITYALIRLLILNDRSIKERYSSLLQMGIMSVVGVCISGIILLPILMFFLNDPRLGLSAQPFHWFYSMSYYANIPGSLVSCRADHWLCLGYSAPVVLGLFLLITDRKKSTHLKILLLLALLVIIFPIGGRILNGMSYATNRWSWSLALLACYILVEKWDDLLSLSKSSWFKLLCVVVLYYLITATNERSKIPSVITASSILAIVMIVLLIKDRLVFKQCAIICLAIISIATISFWHYSPKGTDFTSKLMTNENIRSKWKNNEAVIIRDISDDQYVKYSGSATTANVSMFNDLSNTAYYFTNAIPSFNEFRIDMQMCESSTFHYDGYDDRTSLVALSSVNYYATKKAKRNQIPYGFDLYDVIDKYHIFKNNYPLPFAYCYSSCYDIDAWNSLDPVQKQQIQLDSAVVANPSQFEMDEMTDKVTNYSVPYKIECTENVTQLGNSFVATSKDTKVIIHIEKKYNSSETYLGIEGLDFTPVSRYELYHGDSSVDPQDKYGENEWNVLSADEQMNIKKEHFYWDPIQVAILGFEASSVKKEVEYIPPDGKASSGRHDFIINFCYSEESPDTIEITLPKIGIYSFDAIKVYAVSMDGYTDRIDKLQSDTLNNCTFGVNSVNGDIDLKDPKILCLTTPYSSGWKVFVDGEEHDSLSVNKRYLGAYLPAGHHQIRFEYETPYFKEGAILSLFGLVSFILIVIIYGRKESDGSSG